MRVRRAQRQDPGGARANNGPAGVREPERLAVQRPAAVGAKATARKRGQLVRARVRESRVDRQAQRAHKDASVESGPARQALHRLSEGHRPR